MLNTTVKDYNGSEVLLQNNEVIESKTVIWTAGIKGNVPEGINKELIVKGNRIKVDRHCIVEGTKNIYAIGDVAYMEEPVYPRGHPQVAPVAMQQADLIAKNIQQKNTFKLNEFEYKDKGSMATVGRDLAVADLPKPKITFQRFYCVDSLDVIAFNVDRRSKEPFFCFSQLGV